MYRPGLIARLYPEPTVKQSLTLHPTTMPINEPIRAETVLKATPVTTAGDLPPDTTVVVNPAKNAFAAQILLWGTWVIKGLTIVAGAASFVPQLQPFIPEKYQGVLVGVFMGVSFAKDTIYRACDMLDDGVENKSIQ